MSINSTLSGIIERDSLSVLHKLHDQVNGLQLVQVVVQPLGRLFSPASLAALKASVPSATPANINSPLCNVDTDSYTTSLISNSSRNQRQPGDADSDDIVASTTGLNLSHRKSQNSISGTSQTTSIIHSSNTYMMSPDTAQALIARLDTERDVDWLMEIIGYGLSMPFSSTGQQDSVKDCCTIYCEWLTASLLPYNDLNEDYMYQQLFKLVPTPIRNDPNKYARKMLSHLYNVFLPRNMNSPSATNLSQMSKEQKDYAELMKAAVSRQAVLCHRVLRTIESIADNSLNLMDDQTWTHLLAFLLTLNDKLLSVPIESDDIGTLLQDRVLGVLFELMLAASCKSLPMQDLWDNFQNLSMNWRHRNALLDHWKRITTTLTDRIILVATSANTSHKKIDTRRLSTSQESIDKVITKLTKKDLVYTWYRFLDLMKTSNEYDQSNNFEHGQAEAITILCKIFLAIPSFQEISSVQPTEQTSMNTTRSYGPEHISTYMRKKLAWIILDSKTSPPQNDVDEMNLLISSFMKFIEFVLDSSDLPTQLFQPIQNTKNNRNFSISNIPDVANVDLRHTCILLLLNFLSYPRHFKDSAIQIHSNDDSPTTFYSLRSKLLKCLLTAMQTETDAINMQNLFAGLALVMNDLNLTSYSKTHGSPSTTKNEIQNQKHSFIYESNQGFFVKSLHLTCHLLLNIWKHDTQVSLAAFEVLIAAARVSSLPNIIDCSDSNDNKTVDMNEEYKQTTRWICDYICNQCSRPPTAHSRDMHSTIVAAYQCLSVWFSMHPNLLQDIGCTKNLMEVIELGVSGQKSKTNHINTDGEQIQTVINKSEKQMKPSSIRVRDAAESFLNLCMIKSKQTSINNSELSLHTFDSPVDELSLLEQLKLLDRSDTDELGAVNRCFKFIVDEDSVIYSFLDGSLVQDDNSDQTEYVICIVRTAFGKYCWKFKFRYYSEKARDKIIANKTSAFIKRPISRNSITRSQDKQPTRFFPETLQNLESDALLTRLAPRIDKYFEDFNSKLDLNKILRMTNMQVLNEKKLKSDDTFKRNKEQVYECLQAKCTGNLEASRLIMLHLGLDPSRQQASTMYHKEISEIMNLDQLNTRLCDTVNIFYVRKNQVSKTKILESVSLRCIESFEFFEWLLNLGSIQKQHRGWNEQDLSSRRNNQQRKSLSMSSNQISTSFNATSSDEFESSQDDDSSSEYRELLLDSKHGGSMFDGERTSVYWNDLCQELTFLCPCREEQVSLKVDPNIMIFWVESFDDIQAINCEWPIPETSNDNQCLHVRYFIFAMNGLCRVNFFTSSMRQKLALPVVDGLTVRRDVLSSLIRESVANICRRRRLYSDSYQPPHVKRRIKIQELSNKLKNSVCCGISNQIHSHVLSPTPTCAN